MTPLTATVSPETKRRLEEMARAGHRNLSQVVRLALEQYLERQPAA